MSVQLVEKTITSSEQKFNLPGSYSWEDFKLIQEVLHTSSRLKITYLDGFIEFMTLGERHEKIKTILGFLIEFYLVQKQIEFTPAGSATRESEIKGASFEPDESYYIGQQKEHPDLAIEINITSGNIGKLQRYKRFQIREFGSGRMKKLLFIIYEMLIILKRSIMKKLIRVRFYLN